MCKCMNNCPFLIESAWFGDKCKALNPEKYPGEDMHKYCGSEIFQKTIINVYYIRKRQELDLVAVVI